MMGTQALPNLRCRLSLIFSIGICVSITRNIGVFTKPGYDIFLQFLSLNLETSRNTFVIELLRNLQGTVGWAKLACPSNSSKKFVVLNDVMVLKL